MVGDNAVGMEQEVYSTKQSSEASKGGSLAACVHLRSGASTGVQVNLQRVTRGEFHVAVERAADTLAAGLPLVHGEGGVPTVALPCKGDVDLNTHLILEVDAWLTGCAASACRIAGCAG